MPSLNPVSGTLGNARAAHLLRRTLFGFTPAVRQQFAGLTSQAAVDLLFTLPQPPQAPLDPLTNPLTTWIGQTPVSEPFELDSVLLNWWIAQMKNSGVSIHERLVYYLHTHVPTIIDRVSPIDFIYYQLSLYRFYAFGNFKKLMRAICIDNAMLQHLDGRLNVASAPQENFAREFFELFTVGKGEQVSADNYTTFTEQDVQSATALLTGWDKDDTLASIDPETLLPRGRLKGNGSVASQHALGAKAFSAAFQNTVITSSNSTVQSAENELSEFIDMVFDQDSCAQHIVRKLYRFFVFYQISEEAEVEIIQPLASQLRNSGYEIVTVLKTLLQSEHFFDEDDTVFQNDTRGAIIKSPIEMILNTLNTFEINLPSEQTQNTLFHQTLSDIKSTFSRQGLELYYPYDVAGYDAYFQFPMYNRSWITPNYLAERYKFFERLLTGQVPGLQFDFVNWVKLNISNPSNPDIIIDEMIDILFPFPPDSQRRDFFRNSVLLDNLSVINWQVEWASYVNQGNDAGVRVQLENLFLALTQCPEYQIH